MEGIGMGVYGLWESGVMLWESGTMCVLGPVRFQKKKMKARIG